jgi:uncharacterized protein DUF6923/Big-like domain-containing protein
MTKMNKTIKVLIGVVFVSSIFWSRTNTVSAAAGPFACTSDFYQVISGQLETLDPVTGTYNNIGNNAGFNYNAIGYDTLDNYIYGIVTGGGPTGDLIRISNDGSTTDLGLPTGLPRSGYINGDFDLNGNMYIIANSTTVYEVNVSTLTATALTITGDPIVASAENVFMGGNLYTLQGSTLSVINLTNDTNTNATVSGPSGWLNSSNTFGAGWNDQAGELFFSNNGSGSIYQILDYNSPSPTAVFTLTGTVTNSNDGANCPLATQSPFDPPAANNDSYTTKFNTALNETADPVLSNDVGNGLTVTSNTSPAHGKVSINADGTFLYTPNKGFSGNDSFSYTVTDSFGRTANATVTVTVSPPTAPSTGYGMPNKTNQSILVLASTSIVLLSVGMVLLSNQKRKARIYRMVNF